MWYFHAFLMQYIFNLRQLFIQLYDLFYKPFDGFSSGICSSGQPYAFLCIVYDYSGSAIASSTKLCFMPKAFQPFFIQLHDIRWYRSHLQNLQCKCSINLSKSVHIFRKVNLHFTMETVDISDSVLGKLIPKHGEPSHVCINILWEIRHSIVSIFYKVGNYFRIFSVILELAVIFNLFALLYSIWIYLNNADSI